MERVKNVKKIVVGAASTPAGQFGRKRFSRKRLQKNKFRTHNSKSRMTKVLDALESEFPQIESEFRHLGNGINGLFYGGNSKFPAILQGKRNWGLGSFLRESILHRCS